MSYPKKGSTSCTVSYEQEAIDRFVTAVRSVPIKEISEPGYLSDETVKSWRTKANTPSFAKAMRAARRVQVIQAAVLEIVGGNDPRKNKVLGVLYFRLAEIAAGTDQLSAFKARTALREFAELAR